MQKTPLVVLLLKETTPERHEYHAVLSNISSYSPRLRNILEDGDTRDLVLLGIDHVLPRLQKVFEAMKSGNLPGHVSENLFQGIVSPLLDPHVGVLSLDQALQLAGSTLPVLTKNPSPYLHHLAVTLLGVDGLLGRLASHGTYSTALKGWFLSSKSYLNDLQVQTVTEKLISICDRCPADHGITAVSERWNKAQPLLNSLKMLLDSIQNEERSDKKTTKSLPRLADMKLLSSDDKKSSRAHSGTQSDFRIPEDILKQMALLDMPKPESSRALYSSLAHLQRETPSFMHSALGSFPCRLCWERLTGTLSEPAYTMMVSDTTTGVPIKYNIFGRRVGLWKVLLSDRALRSARKLARTGKLHA